MVFGGSKIKRLGGGIPSKIYGILKILNIFKSILTVLFQNIFGFTRLF